MNVKNLGLEGKELSLYLKNCLMNTANPIIDEKNNVPYSVRYQGAGIVDLYGAVNNNVVATVDGEAKVELREITSKEKSFIITLHNYGDKETSFILFSCLKETSTETGATSSFLGNTNIQRQIFLKYFFSIM